MPTALTTLFTTETDIAALLSAEGVDLRLEDSGEGQVSQAERALIEYARNYATSRVLMYVTAAYDADDLADNWTVVEWATIIAARWLCTRRGNPVPDSIQKMYDEAMDELAAVRAKQLQIPDVAYRSAAFPLWGNTRRDLRYRVRGVRTEQPISEDTPPDYRRDRDLGADYSFEPS